MAYLQTIGSKLPLRAHLQVGTRTSQDRLDRSASASELLRPAGYARFLACQLAARNGIEDRADRHSPPQLRLPVVTALLRANLAELAGERTGGGRPSNSPLAGFVLPTATNSLSVAWAIAGSFLGNRALFARLRKAAAPGSSSSPQRFLTDMRMSAFWHRRLPRLQEPVSATLAAPALVAAANAVLSRFELAFAPAEARSRQAA